MEGDFEREQSEPGEDPRPRVGEPIPEHVYRPSDEEDDEGDEGKHAEQRTRPGDRLACRHGSTIFAR
jgi:hypothetical protein